MEPVEGIEAKMEKASKTLATMLDYLGLEASIKAEARGSKIILLTNSDDAGRIIGRKGQSLESLQLLLNRMMQKIDLDFPRMIIDVDGYSAKPDRRRSGGDRSSRRGGNGGYHRRMTDEEKEQKNENLRQQALDAAKEVKRWGEEVVLPPMNAHDRRIIHITLREDTEIETESLDGGKLKKVVISLKNKPGNDSEPPSPTQET